MGLSRGSRLTEITKIPEGWQVFSFDDIFHFLPTANYPRSFISDIGDIGYIHYGDIHTHKSEFLNCDKVAIPKIDKLRIKNYPSIQEGDLVMVDASEDYEGVGKSIEIRNVSNKSIIAGLHTFLLRANSDLIINGYKGYLQNIEHVKKRMREIATGISVYGISKNNVKKILIPLPPLHEQRAIAEVLSDMDALIQAQEALIEKKKLIKQGVMQELLTGKRRLPGFVSRWENKFLGEISNISTGKRNNEDKVENGDFPFFVRSQNVERINSFSFDGEAILIPGEGGIGTIIHFIKGKFDYHQRVYKISNFSEGVFAPFVYYFMKQFFFSHATSFSVKATVDSLRLPAFLNFVLSIPTFDEQKGIANLLLDIDEEVNLMESELVKLLKLKQGMMQALLTGKIRLV